MLGSLAGEAVTPATAQVSALCHRVPVARRPYRGGERAARRQPFARRSCARCSPRSAPCRRSSRLPFRAAGSDRPPRPARAPAAAPRPRRVGGGGVGPGAGCAHGMAVHIGRVRECPVLGVKFALLGHNAERGAAGASVLNAELALATGWSARRLGPDRAAAHGLRGAGRCCPPWCRTSELARPPSRTKSI